MTNSISLASHSLQVNILAIVDEFRGLRYRVDTRFQHLGSRLNQAYQSQLQTFNSGIQRLQGDLSNKVNSGNNKHSEGLTRIVSDDLGRFSQSISLSLFYFVMKVTL